MEEGGVKFFDYLCMRSMKFACVICLFVYVFSVAIEKDRRAEKQQLLGYYPVVLICSMCLYAGTVV